MISTPMMKLFLILVCTTENQAKTTARFVSLPSWSCSHVVVGVEGLRTCTNPSLCIKGRRLVLSNSFPDSLSLRLRPLLYQIHFHSVVCGPAGDTLGVEGLR